MNYCSLDDAFPTTEGVPSPGCIDERATKQARKEERRKMKRCKQGLDPDRQQYGRLPEVPAMNMSTGLHEHTPDTAPQGEMDIQNPFEQLNPLPTSHNTSVKMDTSQPSTSYKKKIILQIIYRIRKIISCNQISWPHLNKRD